MRRIDTATAALDKFGVGKHGFQDGNPLTGTPPTQLNAKWFDALQEEVARVIESLGWTLDPDDHEQLLKAIRQLITGTIESGDFATAADLLAHITDGNNPHGVTLAQLGGASAAALQAHLANHSNPHQVTLEQLGGAPLDSPQFINTPRAPTPAANDNSTRLATTAFIVTALQGLGLSGGFSQSFGPTGWCRLPNGFIVQWGLNTGVSDPGTINVTFPLTFPNAVLVALCASANRAHLGNLGANFVSALTQSGMVITVDINFSGLRQGYWIAMGH